MVLLLVAVFYLGRWTAEPSAAVVADESAENETAEAELETADQEAEEEEEESFSLTGWITALFSGSDDEEGEENTISEASTTANASNQSTATAETAEPESGSATESGTEESTEQETASEGDVETIITSYSKVSVTINRVITEWKVTWGKIIKVDYTIKNDESGTIKPVYFIMHVEGYEDVNKKITLPPSSQSVDAGQSYSLTVNVPQGFSYSPVTAGDLANVLVTLSLYDESDKAMATSQKEFNLQG